MTEPGAHDPAAAPAPKGKRGPVIAATLGAIAAAVLGYAWFGQRRVHAEPPSGLYVSTAELSAAYLANERDANRVYGERWLSVTGEIAAVRTAGSGHVDVTFTATTSTSYEVHALFSPDADDILADLKPGQTLTATCKVSGVRPTLVLRECIVNALSSVAGGPTAAPMP